MTAAAARARVYSATSRLFSVQPPFTGPVMILQRDHQPLHRPQRPERDDENERQPQHRMHPERRLIDHLGDQGGADHDEAGQKHDEHRRPARGNGKLFQGFLTLRPRCEVCGLDYDFADAGDGPAVFIMFLAGFIVVGAALITEVVYQPPFWVHAVLWLPLILIVTLGPLRPMKGLMIALQYHHRAGEGRLDGKQP